MVRGSAIMWVSRMRNTDSCIASTWSSRAADVAAEGAVAAEEGVDGVAQHGAGAPRHVLERRVGLMSVAPCDGEPLRRLRDVHGVIADALEVARHLDRADDEAEVARHRLLQREQLERRRLELQLHARRARGRPR